MTLHLLDLMDVNSKMWKRKNICSNITQYIIPRCSGENENRTSITHCIHKWYVISSFHNEVWCVYCKQYAENWPYYNGNALNDSAIGRKRIEISHLDIHFSYSLATEVIILINTISIYYLNNSILFSFTDIERCSPLIELCSKNGTGVYRLWLGINSNTW